MKSIIKYILNTGLKIAAMQLLSLQAPPPPFWDEIYVNQRLYYPILHEKHMLIFVTVQNRQKACIRLQTWARCGQQIAVRHVNTVVVDVSVFKFILIDKTFWIKILWAFLL